METLDWTPELSDPDDCTASVHDLEFWEDQLVRLRKYIAYWHRRPIRGTLVLVKLPLAEEPQQLVRCYSNYTFRQALLGCSPVVTQVEMNCILDALPACMKYIRKDKRWSQWTI
jgi:hypothetical protein